MIHMVIIIFFRKDVDIVDKTDDSMSVKQLIHLTGDCNDDHSHDLYDVPRRVRRIPR